MSARGFDHPRGEARDLTARVTALVWGAVGVLHRRVVADVLEVLARFADGSGRCYCAQSTIAKEARYSVRHVLRALEQAEAAGLVLRAVPRYAARLAGAATEYALPWAGLTVARGLEGAREVLGLRKRGPLAAVDAGTAGRLLDVLEQMHPAELVRRVAGRVGGALGAEVVRAYAAELVPRGAPSARPPHVTPGLDKTSRRVTVAENAGGVSRVRGVDRGATPPAVGQSTVAERLRAAMGRASELVAARAGAPQGSPFSESS